MEPMSGQGAAVPSVSGGGDGGAGVATLVPRRVVGDPTAELALRSPQASGGVAGAREASEVGKPPVGAAGGWGRCRCARGGAPGSSTRLGMTAKRKKSSFSKMAIKCPILFWQ